MRRLLVAAAVSGVLAVPVSAVVIGGGSSAWAGSTVTCATLKGTDTGTVTISSCKPTNAQYKTLSGKASKLATGGALTWAPSKKTTIVGGLTTTSPGQGACPKGSTEEISTGTVTGGTATYTHVGDTVSSKVCLKGKTLSLLKGTKLDL